MVYHIEVTAEDIAQGERSDCYACPIALAVKRATGKQVAACHAHVYVGDDKGLLSADARSFVTAFDHNEPVSPFSFDLEVP
jgi:hypothetical protein